MENDKIYVALLMEKGKIIHQFYSHTLKTFKKRLCSWQEKHPNIIVVDDDIISEGYIRDGKTHLFLTQELDIDYGEADVED